MAELAPARHDLVWLQPGCADKLRPLPCAGRIDAPARLAEWIDAGRPLVFARQPAELPPGRVLLGLPLPPSAGKHRIACEAPVSLIARRAPPPPLSAIAALLPADWQPTLQAIGREAAITEARPRAFGSAAMHALTGLECLNPASDLDLLLAPSSREAALRALDALARIDARHDTLSLDGEVLDSFGRATSWRELLSDAPQVLFKHVGGIGLIAREDFLTACGGAPA